MGYMHIDNLYRNPDVLMFQRLYALEKIHGTSAHISWNDGQLGFSSGGANQNNFMALFDTEQLTAGFQEIGHPKVIVYGEAYGGKLQGMSATYGSKLKFVVFEIQIGGNFLDVPKAADVAAKLELEFVDYAEIPATAEAIDTERDKPSAQAIRNGMGNDKIREGVVLRPLIEVRKNNNERIMAKHKRAEFSETKSPRPIADPAQLAVLTAAGAIAEEWVTPMRLTHVLDKLPAVQGVKDTKTVINAMLEDVKREGSGEMVWNKEVEKAIGQQTSKLFQLHIRSAAFKPINKASAA